MPENKHLRLLVLLYIALGALGLWPDGPVSRTLAAPLPDRLALAALLEPPVSPVQGWLHLPRWAPPPCAPCC